MKTECEQLWYTWSNKGFDDTGFQIRAVSPGFLQLQGEQDPTTTQPTIDLSAKRIQTLLQYIHYSLPAGVDPAEVTPEQTPVTLAFIRNNDETFLLHKAYTGNDGTHKNSIYFTHVLADLPFTAREAINLWESPSWKVQDTLAPDERLLPQITFSFAPIVSAHKTIPLVNRTDESEPPEPSTTTPHSLTPPPALPAPSALPAPPTPPTLPPPHFFNQGTLGRHTLKTLDRTHLEFLIQAFLMHRPGQHIYLAGDSATIARLIWGLTNCLPRTLTLFNDLTFSTYEALEDLSTSGIYHTDKDQLLPTIVGTCWLQAQEHELPLSYYHTDGINGFALNCYNNRRTGITPDKFTARFASYAVDCLLEEHDHSIAELHAILTQAEQENCRDLYHFTRIFYSFQQTLEPEDVLSLLRAINENMDNIAEHTTKLLMDIARLRRPNVLRSIVARIAENRYWWESSCLPELNSFYAFMDRYMSLPMPVDIEAVLQNLHGALNDLCEQIALQVNHAIRNNQEENMYFWNDMLEKSAPLPRMEIVWLTFLNTIAMEDLDQPTYQLWWKISGKRIIAALHAAAQGAPIVHEQDMPLNHLGSIIANKIQVALQHNDTWALSAWGETFTQVADPAQEAFAWIYQLRTMTTSPYSTLYWDWWNAYGKAGISALGAALEAGQISTPPQLPGLCNELIRNTVMIIRRANPAAGIQGSGRQEWLLWHEVLSILLPQHDDYEPAQAVWLNLWGSLWPYIFNPSFAQWWHPRGLRVAQAIRTFVEHHPESESANDLTAFILESIVPLAQQQIHHMLEQDLTDPEQEANWEDYQHQLFLLLEILAASTPEQLQTQVWEATEEHIQQFQQETTEEQGDVHPALEGEQSAGSEPAVLSGNLLHLLTETLQGQPADRLYSWEDIRFLLETWSLHPEMHDFEQLRAWLYISWQNVGNLLAMSELPTAWLIQAINNVLATPITLQPHQVSALVVMYQQLFATALLQQLDEPEHSKVAIDFFQYLLDFGYPQKPALLGLLIQGSLERPEQIDRLFKQAELTDEENIDLLENYSTEIIEHDPWSTGLQKQLSRYLTGLDIATLQRPVTRALLHSLNINLNKNLDINLNKQHIAHDEPSQHDSLPVTLRNAIVGWDSIRIFMEPDTDTRQWLQKEARQSRYLAHVPLRYRAKLYEKLTSELVQILHYETNIIIALHNLGPLYATEEDTIVAEQASSQQQDVAERDTTDTGDEARPAQLTESEQAESGKQLFGEEEEQVERNVPFSAELRLLLDLAKQAGTIFANEHPPIHLLPYLKLIQILAQDLIGESKERYLDSSLYPLLIHTTEADRTQINAHIALWLPELRQDWQHYQQRWPKIHERAVLSRFRATLRSGDVELVTEAYQQVLRDVRYPATRINAQERECAQLARDIVTAYNNHDPEMLQQAHQNIQNSPYQKRIHYTPALEQVLHQLTSNPAHSSSSPTHLPSSPSGQSHPSLVASADIADIKTIDQPALPDNIPNIPNVPSIPNIPNARNIQATPPPPAKDPEVQAENAGGRVIGAHISSSRLNQMTPPGKPRLTRPFLQLDSAHNLVTEEDEIEEDVIGTVLDETITLIQLEHVNALKQLYLDFRIHHLEARIPQLPTAERNFYSDEIKALNEQHNMTEESLRTCALDDLIDDVFIRQQIDDLLSIDSKLSPAYFALHPQITARFIAYDPPTYRTISASYHLTGKDTTEVISIFRRRELLAHYLFLKQNKASNDQLDRWLVEERQRQHQRIKIDRERADIHPQRKSHSGFLNVFRRH